MKSRAICPICKKEVESIHVFYVETDEEFCYCPTCGKKIATKEAVDAFNNLIRSMLRRANYNLHIAGQFDKAYRIFGAVLNLQSDNQFALTGRAISLLLMSTLRKQTFQDTRILVRHAKEELRKEANLITYFEFLVRIQSILLYYLKTMKSKLTSRDRFYDAQCAKLYFLRVSQIAELFKASSDEMKLIVQDGLTNSRINDKLVEAENDYEKMMIMLNEEVIDYDGYTYKLNAIKGKDVELNKSEEPAKEKYDSRFRRSLNDCKECRYISDRIFKARRIRFITLLFLNAFAGTLFLIGTILLTIGLTTDIHDLALFISCGVAYGLSLIGFIARLVLKKKIRKTRLINIASDL